MNDTNKQMQRRSSTIVESLGFNTNQISCISHPMICTDARTPLFFISVNMCSSRKSFSSVASNIWTALLNHPTSSIPTVPDVRKALKHHLFLLVHPDSRAKCGNIKPAQCITLHDTAPTTAIGSSCLPSHSPELPCRPSKGVPCERLRLVKVIHFA